MDQGGHRRGPFHRVGQPCVQEQLRRFTHRTDEQQDGNQVGCVPFSPQKRDRSFCQRGRGGKDIVEVDAVGQQEQRENPQRKAEVTHTVDHERLDRRRIGRRFLVVEADEKIGCDAHPFPAEEHLHKVVGSHQHQHGEGEE